MTLSLATLGDHGPLYGPAGAAPCAGVLVLHGAEGPMAGWAHRFAAILAAHGLLALPWGYGEGDFFGSGPIRGVPIAPALEALDALADVPRCTRAGLFGWSKGGELALLLATLAPDKPAFVAAHAAPDRVCAAFDPDAFRATGATEAADGGRAWILPGHDAALAPGTPIPIETYPGPVFLSTGTADEIRDPAATARLADRLAAAGRPADLFLAERQGHALDYDHEPRLWSRLLAFIESTA